MFVVFISKNVLFKVSLFCLAIGQDPKDLSVGIVNGENPEWMGQMGCSNGTFKGVTIYEKLLDQFYRVINTV